MSGWAGSHSSGFPKPTRRAILRRDPICRCTGCPHHQGRCNHPSTEADHIINKAQGGSDHISNGAGICSNCHQAKTATEAATGRAARSPKRNPEPHPGLKPL